MAGFCIDEMSFEHLDDVPTVVQRLNEQLVMLHEEHKQPVLKCSEIYYVDISEGVPFSSLLYDGSTDLIDYDQRLLLMHTIDRCVNWDDEDFQLPDGEVLFRGVETRSSSIMFVASKASVGEAIGLISASPYDRLGPCDATVGATTVTVFHAGLSRDVEHFYRYQLCFEKATREVFALHANLAFPNLRFSLDVANGLRSLDLDYDEYRPEIVKHLAAINDEFLSFLLEGYEPKEVCKRVSATCGVTVSPESPKTHADSKAMAQREVVYNGKKIVCEFHTKFVWNIGRIHFSSTLCTDTNKQNYLVVGAFTGHFKV